MMLLWIILWLFAGQPELVLWNTWSILLTAAVAVQIFASTRGGD
jgi:hypothetical protein